MATVTETKPEDVQTAPQPPKSRWRPYRIDVAMFDRMIAAGLLPPKNRIFLWNGRLVEKMTKHPPHVFAQNRMVTCFRSFPLQGWFIEQDQPVTLGERSVPEPELKVVRGADEDFRKKRPQSSDIALVVEVSDSSLSLDTRSVLQNYARANIPVYWIVNIPDTRIEVYSDPTGPDRKPAYRSRRDYALEEEVPVILDGQEVGKVAVKDVMP
jgi:Putative restriction endonuclease